MRLILSIGYLDSVGQDLRIRIEEACTFRTNEMTEVNIR
jgi:hypothetical protein